MSTRHSHHHDSQLVYTYDRRGLYIKKKMHQQKNKLPREENLIDLEDDSFTTDQLVNDAVHTNINIDNYMKADSATDAAQATGFVDFGDDGLIDDLRVDGKMIDESILDKQALSNKAKRE